MVAPEARRRASEVHVQAGGLHECGPECWSPVRCIICARLKAPEGQEVPTDLAGMRCDATACPGYSLDPRPGHLWPVAERLERPRPPATPVLASAPAPADAADALGRALCAHYFRTGTLSA